MPAAGEITALLGRGTRFEGTLRFEGRVRIDGYFKGEIVGDDTLVIGEGAEVHANITVGTLILRGGIIVGDVVAHESFEMHAPSKVSGNIESPSIFMDRGTTFEGGCRMNSENPPAAVVANNESATSLS